MSDRARLERGYRRLLACYPREFRHENEDEILGVLMATAAESQERVGVAEAADLIRGALRARLRPPAPWPRPLRAAVRLMCAGAVLELVACVTLVVTEGSVRSAILASYPALTAGQWHAIVTGTLLPREIGTAVAAGLWLVLAWASGRGRRWSRIVFAGFFALSIVSMLSAVSAGSAVYAPADLAVGLAVCLVEAAVVALLFSRHSAGYFRPGHGPAPAAAQVWTGTLRPPGVA
jgi:hypothetical protein